MQTRDLHCCCSVEPQGECVIREGFAIGQHRGWTLCSESGSPSWMPTWLFPRLCPSAAGRLSQRQSIWPTLLPETVKAEWIGILFVSCIASEHGPWPIRANSCRPELAAELASATGEMLCPNDPGSPRGGILCNITALDFIGPQVSPVAHWHITHTVVQPGVT